ncbi:hypothetical protein [Halochromatium sp.]
MKQRFFFGLICATLLLLVAGCGSQPTRVSQGVGPSGPEILLPNGKVQEAQLLAMGMAQSKGWTIAAADDQRLLLERQLPENSPQAQLLSPEGILAAPKLQVETQLRERGNDVIVSLSSSVVINPGTEQEHHVDYTKDYQDQLMISLNALASAWLENRTRIASEIPLPPDPDEVVIAEADTSNIDGPSGPSEGVWATGDPVDDAMSSPLDSPTEPSADVSTLDAFAAPAPAETDPGAPSMPRQDGDGTASQPPFASAGTTAGQTAAQAGSQMDRPPLQSVPGTADPDESNDMLVLDGQARRGLWTFYAEASARERGCAVSERGAVLLSTTTAFELYEVQCIDNPNLLLRCQGGVCREIN